MKSILISGEIVIENADSGKTTRINLGDQKRVPAYGVRSLARKLAFQIIGAAK